MEKESTTESQVPESPVLVAPRGATVVDGNAVTFEWRAVEEADRYLLEVARETEFESLVFEEEVTEATELTVTGSFPTDEETFFWRVRAQNEAGWSPGEHIESFVSGTPEDVEQHLAVPDDEEEIGPMEGLVKGASEEVADRLAGSEKRIERERERGVAYEGIEAGQIMAIALTILMTIGIVVVILFMWTTTTSQAIRQAAIDPSGYTELRETEAQAAQKLNQYGVIDRENGVYRIPIERAMDIVANQAYQEGDRAYSSEAPFLQGNQ